MPKSSSFLGPLRNIIKGFYYKKKNAPLIYFVVDNHDKFFYFYIMMFFIFVNPQSKTLKKLLKVL
jgi:hypothetical protein